MKLMLCLVLIIVCFHFKVTLSATNKSDNYAVIRGQMVKMRCIPPDVLIDKSNINGRKSFVWTDEEGKELVNSRMESLVTGELLIPQAHEGDSGTYHCKFRPLKAFEHKGALSRIFVHKLIVYELSGHKFQTLVNFDVTQFGSEATITRLRDLLKYKICTTVLCTPGTVASEKCEMTETERQMCEMAMTYEGVEPPQSVLCDGACARQRTIDRLKKAQKHLESTLLSYSEDPKSRLKPDLETFDTKHVITCRAGYHLIDSNYEHCFPCLPGTYSEQETLRCDMCPVGFYEEKYGSHECKQCPDNLTTDLVGSKTRDDCRPLGDTGVLKDIKEGIAALFRG